MSGSVEIATWIHEYELSALEKYLAVEGTDTEQVMQKMLAELYSARVPLEERQVIQKRIETERAEQLARASRKKVSETARSGGLRSENNLAE